MSDKLETANDPIDSDPSLSKRPCQATDDEVVITGLSGRFPESSSIEEFQKNLMDGVDMVTEDDRRWPRGLHGLPARSGKLKDLKSFDATFFGVHPKQASVMDPQIRILLELTQEAIVDAGVTPMDLRGSRTGVFVGVWNTESREYLTRDPNKITGYEATGCSLSMIPNRISYSFDLKGPSFAVDTGSSSSLYAMHQAVMCMRTGQCDSAIVGGVNLLLDPKTSLQMDRLNMFSRDGACKTFDASANGYVRAEAAVVMFLQKSKNARRIYSTVVHTKVNNDGYKVEGITFPCGSSQNSLMRELLDEAKVDPAEVVYVEAHGTGTRVGDPNEVNSFADLFCERREAPLMVGSVKSNMGHAEAAAALTAIAKVIIAMETGVIPGNLHFNEPNPEIAALKDGRIRVVDKTTAWKGGLVVVNSSGFGGTNARILLRSNEKPKSSPEMKVGMTRMVTVSGRTEEAVGFLLDKIREHKEDDEFVSLINAVHVKDIVGHVWRGYEVFGDERVREVNEFVQDKRPVWYVFAGMGCQWAGMGKQLWPIECFQRSIRRCADALKPEGVDLIDLVLNATGETFSDVVHTFVTIVAIQVALVDVLTVIGIEPDGVVGLSVGELGCAYADGAFTAEQTVLAAYWRGRSILDSDLSPGAMAAVGLGWEEAAKLCPPSVTVACHNSSESSTVSGPADAITKFVEELERRDVFVRVVDSSGVAFHSRYMAKVGPKLRDNLERIIPNSKPRSSRWISSSVPENAWGMPLAQLSSPAYHVNNLLSPVLFQEALTHVPDNAVVIEIAPHCHLQSILRKSLPSTVTNIGLQKRDHPNNLEFLLSAIGKIYNAGGQPIVSRLYPPVSRPVGRGTPMLSSLVKWDHSVEWPVADFSGMSASTGETIVEIDLSTENDAHLAGHNIDGRIFLSATGYLAIAWKAFAKLRRTDYQRLPVVMENVQFLRPTILSTDEPVRLSVNIFDCTPDFVICENGSPIVTGKIRVSEDIEKDLLDLPIPVTENEPELLELRTSDIYKYLRLRGCDYTGMFRGIKSSDNRASIGRLAWEDNWVTFMDTMLQFSVLGKNTHDLHLPTRLRYIAIDPRMQRDLVASLTNDEGLPVYSYPNIGVIKSGGVELRGLKTSFAPRRHRTQATPKHERYVFVPYENTQVLFGDPEIAKRDAITVLLQTVVENLGVLKLKAIEVTGERNAEDLLAPSILKILLDEPSIVVDMQIASTAPESYAALADLWGMMNIAQDAHKVPPGRDLQLVVAAHILSNGESDVLRNLAASLKPGGYILLEETGTIRKSILRNTGLLYVGEQVAPGKTYVLLKHEEEIAEPIVIRIIEKNFSWLGDVKVALRKSETNGDRVLLFSQGEELLGLVGLMNCIRQEAGGMNARYVFIQDDNAPKFSLSTVLYSEQLKKQLTANVFKGGQWGSYRQLLLDQQSCDSLRQVESAYVDALKTGDLSSLQWIESPLKYCLDKCSGKELCSVYYTALNFKDIMLATGKLTADVVSCNLAGHDGFFGLEFAGRDSNGRRVMGMVAAGGLAKTVLADPRLMWQVPDKWSLEEAATIPVCYATSYYALVVKGRMKPGASVLVHSGSGGVGQASISICLRAGCRVFTTVGSQEKRDFLKTRFPQLTDRNIGDSRDTSFEQLVLKETDGAGVDIVLNCLTDEILQASLRCVAPGGRFLEIGESRLSNDIGLEMSMFPKNASLHTVSLDALVERDSADRREVVRLVREGIESGAVEPLPVTVFTDQQIERSFRYMTTGKHIGKVLIKVRDEETRKSTKPAPKTVAAVPRTYMSPDKSYVLVGGLGGFGLELANWMIHRGARYVVLSSRSGVRTGYQSLCIRRWREIGIKIDVSTADAATTAGAVKLLEEANSIAPVGGIFNLAAVIKDALIENQQESDFETVALPKINATMNLDAASRELCPSLDFFVCFSSGSCGRGNPGQTNYGLANSAMERIVERRHADGFPGLAIQWGLIGDVGLVLETMGDNETEVQGIIPQRMASCLETMDSFLRQTHPILGSIVLAEKHKPGNATERISLVEAVANILGIRDAESANAKSTLVDLGMDSLMGTDIKRTLERNYDLILSASEIRGLTFATLRSLAAGRAEASPQKVDS